MTTTASTLSAHQFIFTLDQGLAKGAIQIDPGSHPELLAALVGPGAQLPTGDVLLIGGDLSVAPGNDITVGPAKVGFTADINAAIGVFSTPAGARDAVLKNADLVSQIAGTLHFSGADGSKFLMLRWGYDIGGTATGSVARNTPSATGCQER